MGANGRFTRTGTYRTGTVTLCKHVPSAPRSYGYTIILSPIYYRAGGQKRRTPHCCWFRLKKDAADHLHSGAINWILDSQGGQPPHDT